MTMTSIGKEFMLKTQNRFLEPSHEFQRLPQPPLELPCPAGAALISLPAPAVIQAPAIDLRKAVEQRRSLRNYAGTPLTLSELAFLLWMTQGVKKVTPRPATFRTVPSAGARHAFETYLVINQVEGLAPGLYRYAAIEHALLELKLSSKICDQLALACGNQNQICTSAVTFAWVAVTERMYYRYGERGYRYLFLDAGHVCQNLSLAAEAINCGTCAIAAYDDIATNQTLGLDGEELFTIYLASVGKKPER
jgi:SagB-type dehydrogenase family enzyme